MSLADLTLRVSDLHTQVQEISLLVIDNLRPKLSDLSTNIQEFNSKPALLDTRRGRGTWGPHRGRGTRASGQFRHGGAGIPSSTPTTITALPPFSNPSPSAAVSTSKDDCRNCHSENHSFRECSQWLKLPAICWKCGSPSHRGRGKKKEENYIKKGRKGLFGLYIRPAHGKLICRGKK